jgi:DNA-3-methyladenine glycosylase II
MAGLVGKHPPCPLASREYRPFHTLAASIIGQQLSAKAAETIERRVAEVVGTPFTPPEFLSVRTETLRAAGLSQAKGRYIRELADRLVTGRLDLDVLAEQDDDDAIARLIELPGIGRWTAEMFLIFGLKRPDVLSRGDAGLQRAARLLYGMNGGEDVLERVSAEWAPYRSVASWYLWKHLEVVA